MYLTTKIEKEHETVDVALFCYCTVDTTVENSHQTQATWKKKRSSVPLAVDNIWPSKSWLWFSLQPGINQSGFVHDIMIKVFTEIITPFVCKADCALKV